MGIRIVALFGEGTVTLLRMYAITAIVLAIKMSAISIVQGRARVAAGVFVNPEDAKTFRASEGPEDAPTVRRASRAWLNDLENIPIFLILCGIYVMAGLSAGAFLIYSLIFILAPLAHTLSS